MDALYKFSAFAGTIPRRVRDGDPHGRRLRHGGSVAGGGRDGVRIESPTRTALQYSPARRENFVRNHRPAGARPAVAYAGQYADPYTYGGDPVNYADPAGLWSLGVGLVFGWDKSHGWNVGVESGPFSYSWNQDGSGSFNVGVHGNYQFYILNLGGSLGYSYNTYTGHALSADGTACIGVKEGDAGLCAGVEAGGGLHWDPHGNFLGATVYSGVFAEARLNEEASLKVHGGYEWGFLGMEGRGFYLGGDIGGLNAEWSRNGGWNYGFRQSFEAWRYEKDGDLPKWEILGGVLRSGDGEIFSADGAYYDDNGGDPKVAIWAEYLHEMDPDEYSFLGHYDVETGGFVLNPSSDDGWMEPAVLATEILHGNYNYKGERALRFYSCNLAQGRGAESISSMMPNKTIVAPTGRVAVQPVYFLWKLIEVRAIVLDGGKWVSYRNGVRQ